MQSDSVFTKTGRDGIRRPSTGIKVLLFMLPWMFIVLGLLLGFISYTFVSSAERTTARVTTYVEWQDGFTPLLEFKVDDKLIATPLGTVMEPAILPAGTIVEILYDPVIPGNARLAGLAYNYGFAALVVGIGAILLALSQIIWIVLRRRVAKNPQKGLRA